MSEFNEMQALTNSPCIILDRDGNEFKCSFPSIKELVTLQGKAKSLLLEKTVSLSKAMLAGGASQVAIDNLWDVFQKEDDETSLKNCLADPAMFEGLIKICIFKNHKDISNEKISELLTMENISKITRYFSNLKDVISLSEDKAEKN